MTVYIVDVLRSPLCSYLGNLSNLSLKNLGTEVIKNLLIKSNIDPKLIDLVYIGNVISSGNGQNIARIISYEAGINAPSITINNVCGSGMESIRNGFNSIRIGDSDCVLVGGIEHMSSTPYLNKYIKQGNKMGNINLIDSMINDGLTDSFSDKHMGDITHDMNIKNNLTLEELNNYALMSYNRAKNNIINLSKEMCQINVKNNIILHDEEINKNDINKLTKLKPVFGNTITAGNASKLSDGACFMILCSDKFIKKHNINPIAIIKDIDISVDLPENFPIVPIQSVEKLCKKLNIDINSIDLFEINEAFATVPLLFSKKLNIDLNKINIYGGAIALGHPLGCSGSRIVCTLLNSLKTENKNIGCASICVGGGGAVSIIIEKL